MDFPEKLIPQTLANLVESKGAMILITPWLMETIWLGKVTALSQCHPVLPAGHMQHESPPTGSIEIMYHSIRMTRVDHELARFITSFIQEFFHHTYWAAWKS